MVQRVLLGHWVPVCGDFCQEAKPPEDVPRDEAKPAEAFTTSFCDCSGLGVAEPTKAVIFHC